LEAYIQPNPALRAEEFFMDKIDKPKRDRVIPAEDFGKTLSEASQALGAGIGANDSYVGALQKVGKAEEALGQTERGYLLNVETTLLRPLKVFLEGDLKTVQRERKLLEEKRLDLDASKNKLKRAKSDSAKSTAEAELMTVKYDFEKQLESTRKLLENITKVQNNQVAALTEFVNAQSTYYTQCLQHVQDLKRSL